MSRRLPLFTVVLFWILPACSTSDVIHAAEVPQRNVQRSQSEYRQMRDKRTGAVVVRITPVKNVASLRPGMVAGAKVGSPSSVLFGFRSAAKRWRFEGCKSMVLFADGAEVARPAIAREAQIDSGSLSEIVYSALSLGIVVSLANADHSSAKVCGHVIALSIEEKANLRRLVSRMTRISYVVP